MMVPSRVTMKQEPGAIRERERRRNQDRHVRLLLLLGLLTMFIAAAGDGLLPHLVTWRLGSRCLPSSPQPCRPEIRHPDLDVVSVAVKPSCVSKLAVAALNQYVGPRRILIITTSEEKCKLFRAMATNVRCYLENNLVPGITKETVEAALKVKYGADGRQEFVGRQLSGWYLQQLLKLGAAGHISDLSECFMLWDLDMVLLWPLRIFKGRSPSSNHRVVIRQIGGYTLPGYAASYAKLTGEKMVYAPDGSSFVTHNMVVVKNFMTEMLERFAQSAAGGGSGTWVERQGWEAQVEANATGGYGDGLESLGLPHWAEAVLGALDTDTLDLGFSEYASYASWVQHHHPETVEMTPRRTWTRHPLGKVGIITQKWLHPGGLCCPGDILVSFMKLLGFKYTGFEVGHVASCGYNLPGNSISYGLRDLPGGSPPETSW